ncbi:alpha-D-ribose 1-methylphosphonate 5-triphosphate diphosphatase [Arboricoccus pini]|uniref:Alpha-D-ribose 1-methylphosphonate 5-triphosphate diphosphatase n=1 Tax=Arboricoccus pini TaxID=1963835 RepID=A0A212R1X9_9PROT|nr:alpha-D-ribose 1-methylphosphonate 5-triphosphate diphosphatase [Arboricoccus pini]SNB66012.1 alpha-D-ribose 1-methylphosphonate 5-triphosphate diphosphatase [Arboricoccus pini]
MNSLTMIENARLVLPEEILDQGWLAVVDGRIAELGQGRPPERGVDLGGDLLLPGLVELHTDHIESHFTPRPKVRWNALGAAISYDAQMAASGITTVFDSLRIGSDFDQDDKSDDIWLLAESIQTARQAGRLRVEHRTHLRCEIAAGDVVDQLQRFAERYPVHLMSLMDHTPGQRQFRDIAIWKTYYCGKTGRSGNEADALISHRRALNERNAQKHRLMMVEFAQTHGIPLASHDDTTEQHVAEAVADGVAIAEFPTTLTAAEHAHAHGISVLMGAPNIVRGGSHSGNVAALELASHGLLDLLSSDYVPSSLLMAAFELTARLPVIKLPRAVAMISRNPARAAGLDDRGALVAGLRADLVRVAMLGDQPVPVAVYREGKRVA